MGDLNIKDVTLDSPIILNENLESIQTMSTQFVEKSSQNTISTYLLILCGVVILMSYLQMLWRKKRLYWYYYKTPGPIGLPFIGIGYKFVALDMSVTLQRIFDVQVAYPQVASTWFGSRLYYIASKPEYIEKILKSQSALDKAHIYEFTNDIDGLLNLGEKTWKVHRKTIMPAFNQKILNSFQDIFWEKAEIFANLLQKEVKNKNLDLFTLLSGCTMDIVCETALGVNMHVQTSNELGFITALNKVLEITSIRTLHFWHQLRFTWKLYPISREFDKALNDFEDFIRAVISNKRRDYEHKLTKKNSSLENGTALTVEGEDRDTVAFLDLIDNDKFSERELMDEIKTFFLAAVDTTASTLCSIFVMLGLFQDVQQKVLEELIDVLGPDRRPVTDDLPKMKYLERVIKETLRLFPAVPMIGRTLHEDIDAGDMVFPSGCSVIIGTVFVHRNPVYWPDPLKFDPDRFLPENIAKRHPCTYIPFSYGPRNCVGGKYAMMNMKTILASVLRRFKIFTEYKSVEEITISSYLILRLRDGPKVWIEPR